MKTKNTFLERSVRHTVNTPIRFALSSSGRSATVVDETGRKHLMAVARRELIVERPSKRLEEAKREEQPPKAEVSKGAAEKPKPPQAPPPPKEERAPDTQVVRLPG